MFAQIALLSPPFCKLDYLIPEWFEPGLIQAGLRVAIPFGKNNQTRCGFITGCLEKSSFADSAKIKPILWPLEIKPLINAELLELSKNLALRQALQPGEIFGHVLPAGLRQSRIKISGQHKNAPASFEIEEISSLPDKTKIELLASFLAGQMNIHSPVQEESSNEIWSVACDRPWPLRPAARKQIQLLDYLDKHGSCTRKELYAAFGSGIRETLQALLQKKLLLKEKSLTDPIKPDPLQIPVLNEDQKWAYEHLQGMMDDDTAHCELLHGVTGSGKTAIYLKLAQFALMRGKSIFLLAPEIALATRLHEIASASLPAARVHLFHGYQNVSVREKTFRDLASSSEPAIVVGTRSALFLPLHKPGLIILDEEHDASFKQDEGFVYHAREAAWQRCLHNNALMLAGSATPDIRTFYASSNGSIGFSQLKKRATGRNLPPIRLVQLEAKKTDGIAGALNCGSLLAWETEQALADCVKRGDQAIILLNRRGYAPLMFCPSCSKTVHCPKCEIALTYHKNSNRLLCHYCGYSLPYPSPCPDCGHVNLMALGEGTEKLEERLEAIACQPILRLDRDSTRRKGKLEDIMARFAKGESPFLVGTQMISKGHHFPNVTLAVVADGDMGLNLPDYRAAERTFQLLVQTAGRAGRGEKEGEVLIQTRNPAHYCWDFIKNYDYEGFYAQELFRRKKHAYPPFVKLAILRLSSKSELQKCAAHLAIIAKTLRPVAEKLNLKLLGPAPSPLACINGYRRFHFLIKGERWENIRKIYFYLLQNSTSRLFRIFLDLDPVNMM